MITFDEYQNLAKTTAIYPKERGLEYVVLGLVGEAGELANKVKKVIRDDGGVLSEDKRKDLLKEAGDVTWYLASLFTELKESFGNAAQNNIDKLFSRKERGTLGGSGDNR